MRNMSFALTTEQIRSRTKTVTRRLGWRFLKPGDFVQPVVKSQGLKPGEGVQKIGEPIRIVRVTSETLSDICGTDERGYLETYREGFPRMAPSEFVSMFCEHMRPCQPNWEVTRIEFVYPSLPSASPAPEERSPE